MPLAPGTRLGTYDIVEPIGAGGMGEVYRARDSRLGREVAIKVLPDDVAQDAERVGRFEREAKSLAALNHPHIATLFGMEQVDARHLLIMELVEGESLSDVLARGPLPVAEAVRIARQVAEALESAHERGIVHRDLKPANVKLTANESVKVLDFGLAKAMESSPGSAPALTQSPTLSVMATAAGVILGTAAYMSPEQAKGMAADHRSDVFAFGALFYELLSGRQSFPGETVHDILASVIAREPDWTALPRPLNPRLVELLHRCLEKSRRQRWQSIGDVRLELEIIAQDPAGAASPPTSSAADTARRPWWRAALPFVAGGAVASAAFALVAPPLRPAAPGAQVVRFELPVQQRRILNETALAIAPDGSSLIFSSDGGVSLRELSSFESRPIPGVPGGVAAPIWIAYSPDSRSIAFVEGTSVKTVALAGGPPTVRGEVTGAVTGLTWDADGLLLSANPGGIVRLPDGGGPMQTLVTAAADERVARPSILPGGRAVLFTVAKGTPRPDWAAAEIVAETLDGSHRRVVITAGADAQYLPTGHLAYAAEGVLFLAPFDPGTFAVGGVPVPVIEGVGRAYNGGLLTPVVQLAVSRTGTLAYFPGAASLSRTGGGGPVIFTAIDGQDQRVPLPEATYEAPRISPDGKQLAISSVDGTNAIVWVYDMSGTRALRRLTFGGRNRIPVWSPDGSRLAFQSDREGDGAIWVQRADGTDDPVRLTRAEPSTSRVPESWSSDGRYLSFSVVSDTGSSELWLYDFRERTAKPFGGVTGRGPANSAFSPDGRWIAYTSRKERISIIVAAVANRSARYEVSPIDDTGHHPFWSRDGRTLYYMGVFGSALVAAPVTLQPTFSSGVATVVPGSHVSNTTAMDPLNYDITPDGRRFVRIANEAVVASQSGRTLRVVTNWFDELKQRLGAR